MRGGDDVQTTAGEPRRRPPGRTAPVRPVSGRPVSGQRTRMNLGILIAVVLMVCYGLLILFSASMTEGYASEGDPTFYAVKQAGITLAGILLMLVLSRLNVRFFNRPVFFISAYAVITGLLLLTHLPFGVAQTINGATRWLALPGLPQFQPSELAKVGLVFCFAGYTSWIRQRRQEKGVRRGFFREGLWQFVVPAAAVALWALLIVTQPHLSGAVILCLLALCCFLAAGFSPKVWAAGLLILLVFVLIFLLVAVYFILPSLPDDSLGQYDYWKRRINVFTDSDEASDADRFQSEQSMIAIGSGGLTGLGLGQGRQKFNYLPEEFNDYVFSILAEELGLLGSLSVLLLFTVFLLLGAVAATKAQSPYVRILLFGYTALIAIQAYLNIGVAVGVLPPTGISLPLFSYGGTSNLFFLAGIGLIAQCDPGSRCRAGGEEGAP